jgi:(p)ppGpp synthase/HD superfamily hydrolase
MMNTPILTDKFPTALVYATRLHANQTRKISGVPYIAHLLSVAALVLEAGGNEQEAIAALLHDSIEDQGGSQTRADIREIFGDGVVEIIDGCTECDTYPKPPWKERKLKYLENIRHASPSVKLISLADKLHNARSLLVDARKYHYTPQKSIWMEFKGGKEGTLWFFRELLQIYQSDRAATPGEYPTNFLVEDFSLVVEALKKL